MMRGRASTTFMLRGGNSGKAQRYTGIGIGNGSRFWVLPGPLISCGYDANRTGFLPSFFDPFFSEDAAFFLSREEAASSFVPY